MYNGTKREFFEHLDDVFGSLESDESVTFPPPTAATRPEKRKLKDVNCSANHEKASMTKRTAVLTALDNVPPASKVPATEIPAGHSDQNEAGALDRNVTYQSNTVDVPTVKVPKTAKGEKLFDNLVFYFIPNSRINKARDLRMKKVEQYGGTIAKQFSQSVTHIISDKGYTANLILKATALEHLPPGMHAFNELWTPDCVIYGRLLETNTKYEISGLATQLSEVASPSRTEQDSQPKSLQIKPTPMKDNVRTPQNSASQPSDLTISPSVAFARSNEKLDRVPTTQPKDELDVAMDAVHRLGSTMMAHESQEEEDSNGLAASPHESYVQRRVWQDKFKCMAAHPQNKPPNLGPNSFVVERMKTMLEYYETSRHPDDQWRVRGYRLAIASLKASSKAITTLEEAKALPNIGQRLATHITEIVETGRLERIEHFDDKYKIVRNFMQIYGVGPVRADEWARQGLVTHQDILERGSPTANQRVGIDLYDDLLQRIPRAECKLHKKLVKQEALKIDPELQCYVMGSYRRGAETCGDIDIMVTKKAASTAELVALWQRLLQVLRDKLKFLTHGLIVSSGRDGLKWQGIGRLTTSLPHRRIDFLLVPWRQRGPALLYFTGNDLFNRSMRLLARRKGYSLSEKGLFVGTLRDRQVKVTQGTNTGAETEEEIFEMLGVPYRRPEDRCVD